MGIESIKIKNIKNNALKTLANNLDTDKNKEINGQEISIFAERAQKLVELGAISQTDYNKLGLPAETPTAVETPQQAQGEVQAPVETKPNPTRAQQRRSAKEANEVLVATLNSALAWEEDVKLSNLVEKLGDKLDENEKAIVNEIVSLMNEKDYNEHADIRRNHDEIAKTLRQSHKGEAGNYIRVLNVLESIVEKSIRKAAYDGAKATADTLKETMEDTRYSEAVLQATREALKNDGDGMNADKRKAYRALRNDGTKDSQKLIMNTIKEQTNPEISEGEDAPTNEKLTRRGYIRRQTKADLKADGDWDKVTREAFNDGRGREIIIGERSYTTSLAQIQAAKNDVEQSTIQTDEEVRGKVGKMLPLNMLKKAGYANYDEKSGKWDFSKLSKEILEYLGADLELNRDAKKDGAVAELKNLRDRLAEISHNESLTEAQTKELIKLCGYDIERKNWRGIIAGMLTGGLVGAGTAAAAETSVPHSVYTANKLVANVNGTTVELTSDTFIKFASQAGAAAAIGAVLPAVLGALAGVKDKGQVPVIPMSFKAETIEEYENSIRKSHPQYADAFVALASCFRNEDGSWDKEGYKNFLENKAGMSNDILNKSEMLGALMELKIDDQEEDKSTCTITVEEHTTDPQNNVEDLTYIHHRKGGDSWAGIVNAYYPDLVAQFGLYGKDGAIKRLQRALAVNEDGTYNREIFSKIVTATDLPKEMKLPSEIDGVKRVIGQVKAVTIQSGDGEYKAALDRVGRDEINVTMIPGSTTYVATDCDGNRATGATREEAIESLKEEHPEKNYVVPEE